MGAPSKTVPTGHAGAGGSYDRRLEITFSDSSGTYKFLVELMCQTDAEIAAGQIQLYMGIAFQEGSGTRYIDFFADKNNLNAQKYEFFMDMDSSAATGDQFLGLKMNINATANTFNYDMLMANQDSGGSGVVYSGMRLNVKGDVASDDFTFGFQNTGNVASFAAVEAAAGSTSSDVTHTFSVCSSCTGPASDEYVSMCLDGDGSGTYSGPSDSEILNGAECAGLSLTQNTSAPALDSSGLWNITWAAEPPCFVLIDKRCSLCFEII